MDINTYLENLQSENYFLEADIKSLMNIPKEKIEKSLKNLKSALDSKNIGKLKTIVNSFPKVEFEKIEKYAKSKIESFKSLQIIAEKSLLKSSPVKKDIDKKGIKILSSLLASISSLNKNPKAKLNNFLKKINEDKTKIDWYGYLRILIGSLFLSLTLSIAAGTFAPLSIIMPSILTVMLIALLIQSVFSN